MLNDDKKKADAVTSITAELSSVKKNNKKKQIAFKLFHDYTICTLISNSIAISKETFKKLSQETPKWHNISL